MEKLKENIESFKYMFQLCKYAQNTTIDRKTSEYFDLTIYFNSKIIYLNGIMLCDHEVNALEPILKELK